MLSIEDVLYKIRRSSMASYTPVQLAFNAVEPEGGASEKSPIIFAHGLSLSKEHWEDLTRHVANATKRKVYAIDARNHGDSEWNDIFNFDCNVDDLLHFMDAAGISKAIIIGHSMGGMTGMKMALKAPERVEKLIVEDMCAKKPIPEMVNMVRMMMGHLRNAIQQVPNDVNQVTARKIILDFLIAQEDFTQCMKPDSLKKIKVQLNRAEDGRYSYKANVDVLERTMENSSEIMTDIEGVYEGPTFFVYGELSPFLVGLDEPNIRKHFPNAELTGIENATHDVHSECPKEFTEAVLHFILKD